MGVGKVAAEKAAREIVFSALDKPEPFDALVAAFATVFMNPERIEGELATVVVRIPEPAPESISAARRALADACKAARKSKRAIFALEPGPGSNIVR